MGPPKVAFDGGAARRSASGFGLLDGVAGSGGGGVAMGQGGMLAPGGGGNANQCRFEERAFPRKISMLFLILANVAESSRWLLGRVDDGAELSRHK